jgi:hypothetical protein
MPTRSKAGPPAAPVSGPFKVTLGFHFTVEYDPVKNWDGDADKTFPSYIWINTNDTVPSPYTTLPFVPQPGLSWAPYVLSAIVDADQQTNDSNLFNNQITQTLIIKPPLLVLPVGLTRQQ